MIRNFFSRSDQVNGRRPYDPNKGTKKITVGVERSDCPICHLPVGSSELGAVEIEDGKAHGVCAKVKKSACCQ